MSVVCVVCVVCVCVVLWFGEKEIEREGER